MNAGHAGNRGQAQPPVSTALKVHMLACRCSVLSLQGSKRPVPVNCLSNGSPCADELAELAASMAAQPLTCREVPALCWSGCLAPAVDSPHEIFDW